LQSGFQQRHQPDPAGDNWWYEGIGKGAGSNNSRPPVPEDVWTSPGYQAKVNDAYNWMHYEWQNGTEGTSMTTRSRVARQEPAPDFEENNAYSRSNFLSIL